jgi:hypothetical protein
MTVGGHSSAVLDIDVHVIEVVTQPLVPRVLNLECTHSWMNDVGQIRPQKGLNISTQAVVRIGTW